MTGVGAGMVLVWYWCGTGVVLVWYGTFDKCSYDDRENSILQSIYVHCTYFKVKINTVFVPVAVPFVGSIRSRLVGYRYLFWAFFFWVARNNTSFGVKMFLTGGVQYPFGVFFLGGEVQYLFWGQIFLTSGVLYSF